MNTDLPAALQGGGTITWLNLQPIFDRRQLGEVAQFWEAQNGTNIVDASVFQVSDMRDYFLFRRLPA